MPRTLVTGATGLLGPYLAEAASALGEVWTTSRRGGDSPCDLTEPRAVRRLLERVRPDTLLHAAALTDVDLAEREPALAFALNRDAVVNLSAALSPEAAFVLISTDQVYPASGAPHREGTEAPVNAYGRSKLAGEQALRVRSRHLVLRTNFFGPSRTEGRSSLSDFIIRSLTEGRPITLFEDVHFSPLHLASLCELVIEALGRGLTGVFNAGTRDGLSKKDFGLALAALLDLPTGTVTVGRSADLPGRAPRPLDLRLDVTRLERALGRAMPTLAEEIGRLPR